MTSQLEYRHACFVLWQYNWLHQVKEQKDKWSWDWCWWKLVKQMVINYLTGIEVSLIRPTWHVRATCLNETKDSCAVLWFYLRRWFGSPYLGFSIMYLWLFLSDLGRDYPLPAEFNYWNILLYKKLKMREAQNIIYRVFMTYFSRRYITNRKIIIQDGGQSKYV